MAAQAPKNNSSPHTPASQVNSIPVEMAADPCFHSELENSSVRLFQVEVAPQASTGLDVHPHDYIVFALTNAGFQVSGKGNSFSLQMAPGDLQILKGGWPHRLVNNTDASMKLVELEVEHGIDPEHPLCGLAAAECTDGLFGGDEKGGFTASTLFETPTVKLQRVDLGTNGVLPMHRHVQSHLLVALADVKFRDQQDVMDSSTDANADANKDANTPGNKDSQITSKDVQLKAGEVIWYEGAIEHSLTNLSDQYAPLITVEFKK